MRKNIFLFSLCFTIITLVSSCGTSSPMGLGLKAIQAILRTSTNHGFKVMSNPEEFVSSALFEAAMPQKLKDINEKLEAIGMGHLVKQEKQYIAQAAQLTAGIAKPIVNKAINEMTAQDAAHIIAGGKGAATRYLREKTQKQLVQAIQPKINEELNKVGLLKTLNAAIGGGNAGNILGAILGKNSQGQADTTAPISQLASQQVVNGLFKLIENYEVNHRLNPALGVNKAL